MLTFHRNCDQSHILTVVQQLQTNEVLGDCSEVQNKNGFPWTQLSDKQ